MKYDCDYIRSTKSKSGQLIYYYSSETVSFNFAMVIKPQISFYDEFQLKNKDYDNLYYCVLFDFILGKIVSILHSFKTGIRLYTECPNDDIKQKH